MNDISGNPLVIDTPGASAITARTFKAYKIRLVGATTAGHTAVIQNASGQTKMKFQANGADYSESESFPDDCRLVFEGLIVPTLGSGEIHIYVEGKVPIT